MINKIFSKQTFPSEVKLNKLMLIHQNCESLFCFFLAENLNFL